MRILVQRSKRSYVKVEDKIVGEIESGYVLFVGFTEGDTKEIINKMIKKVLNLRILDDNNGVMNESIIDHKESILSISQFTLYADTKRGNRPSYISALKNTEEKKLYEYFNKELSKYIEVQTGIFGSDMEVHITNDGPVTIMLEG